MVEMDRLMLQHKKDHTDNPFLSVMQSFNNSITNSAQGNTLKVLGNTYEIKIKEEEEKDNIKRSALPPLRQVSSAQAPTVNMQQHQTSSSSSSSAATTPIYSQSTRTSGINQFNYNNYTNELQIQNHALSPLKPPTITNNSKPNSLSNIPQISDQYYPYTTGQITTNVPTPSTIYNVQTIQNTQNVAQTTTTSQPFLQIPQQKSSIPDIQQQQLSLPSSDSKKQQEIFDTHDKLDLYCTNCDQYYRSGIYFEHVKICDKDHARKMNQSLDDTFQNLEQSSAVMSRLDQKIDKISRNISNAIQLQKLPQTRDILSQTIIDLADTLKSQNTQVVKNIIKKLEQNAKLLDPNAAAATTQTTSYKLYLYLKRVTNILREKETALEQSAMLREISMIYPSNKPNNNNNQAQQQLQLQQLQQQQQQQNFYAPRFSYQPNSNVMPSNNFLTRNTVSTNQELDKKSKFYDIAGEIKNTLPPNHIGCQFLISELYEEAKGLSENQWKEYLQNKFQSR